MCIRDSLCVVDTEKNDRIYSICKKLNAVFEDHVEFVGDRIGKDSAYHLDSKKIRAELHWQDRIDLDQGLDGCIAWVKNNFDILKNEDFDYRHKS